MNSKKSQTTEPENQENETPDSTTNFPVVAIGASAGGLEALEQFFENTPSDSGMSFVVIQHLDPKHISIMHELLQRVTTMKVVQAIDKERLRPDCVYVMPPNKNMSLLHGSLHLFDPVEAHGVRLPIDAFFRSMAEDRKEKSIGIILSGMGSDGSLGLKAIKEKNGMALVQDSATAKFDGMPRSATEAVIADVVAPAEELPARLLTLLRFYPLNTSELPLDHKNKSNLEKIIILLREKSGQDFSLYKKNTLFRRIERRKGVHQIEKTENYIRFLQENPSEIEVLFKELLIGVTNFFRDTAVWEMLGTAILPPYLNSLPNGQILRAWVPACSTGEEAYSLAIIFREAMEKLDPRKNLTLQIFATDIDQDAIEIARKGVFPSNIINDVSPERISRFFTAEGAGFRINAPIRDMVVFAPQSVIKDPPFTKLDILTCRNMLIYMEPELQKKLMTLFNYSLNQGGILILGTAESLGHNNEGFEELDSRLKIYRRSVTAEKPRLVDFPSTFNINRKENSEMASSSTSAGNIQNLADQILLQNYAPPSVMVNEKGEILYITGRPGKYIEPIAGKANWNIFAMAREGLREALPAAFRKAMLNFDPVILNNIKIGTLEANCDTDITIRRIEQPDAIRGMIMIIFNDKPPLPEQEKEILQAVKSRSSSKQKELELKLLRSNEDLKSIREEMQSSQEELKSTNEELQSTNEELQSTNEELTTSKEEMQSLNEELQTVNSELQNKVSDFVQANNDMKNLLNSTEIATLFLDKELNIRRFTDQATKIFKLRNADVGRPFTDLVTDLKYPEIERNARLVLKTLIPIETETPTVDDRWFNVRIMPYRTLDDRIDGLVITCTDITQTKMSQVAFTLSEIRYKRLFESAKDGILILDAETGSIKDVNPYLSELLGYSKEEIIEKFIWEIGFLKDIVANKEKLSELQQKQIVRYDNLPLETSKGEKINVEFISNIYTVENLKEIQCIIRNSTRNIQE